MAVQKQWRVLLAFVLAAGLWGGRGADAGCITSPNGNGHVDFLLGNFMPADAFKSVQPRALDPSNPAFFQHETACLKNPVLSHGAYPWIWVWQSVGGVHRPSLSLLKSGKSFGCQ